MTKEELVKEAVEFERIHKSFKSTSEKVVGVRKAKELVLALNEFYKESNEVELMDLMKLITIVKKKFDKKLNRGT